MRAGGADGANTTILGGTWSSVANAFSLYENIMLVFKDTILGLVASIQLMANDMVRVGDWIEMPKYGADGDVLAVTPGREEECRATVNSICDQFMESTEGLH